MKAEQLKEDVLRAEGYAEGFRAGYTACAQRVANELAKEDSTKVPISETTPPVESKSGGTSGN